MAAAGIAIATLLVVVPICFLVLASGGVPNPRPRNAVALRTTTLATVPPTTVPATTTTTAPADVQVRGVVVTRPAPSTVPPTTQPPAPPPAPLPPRSYLYGPNAGFPRTATITVGSTIAAPGLAEAAAYWNQLAGRTLFAIGASASQVTLRAGEGVCGTGAVACSAPISAIDHTWHPDMNYPYSHCDVYVLSAWVGNWSVIAHELGHCLGFEHVTDWLSVMTSPPHPDAVLDRNLLVGAGYVS
jgi:hypothetical protein